MTDTAIAVQPAESGHWYKPDGTPCYEVQAKSGAMRPTTLRDARKLGLYPSVTGIIKCAASPALEIWKQKQVLLAALTLPRIEGESDDAFALRVMADSKQEAIDAALAGERVHAAIERAFRGEPIANEYTRPVLDFSAALLAKFGTSVGFAAEHTFGCSLGFGGKVDLHQPGILVDIKTKDEVSDKMELYDEHLMQLAAYRHGLGLSEDAICAIAFIRRTPPWKVVIVEADPKDLRQGWEMFQALLAYWQAKTNHRPEPIKVAA